MLSACTHLTLLLASGFSSGIWLLKTACPSFIPTFLVLVLASLLASGFSSGIWLLGAAFPSFIPAHHLVIKASLQCLRSWADWPACHRPARMARIHACAAGRNGRRATAPPAWPSSMPAQLGGMAGVPPPCPHGPHPCMRMLGQIGQWLLTRPHNLGNVSSSRSGCV